VSRQLPSLHDLDKMTSLNSLNTDGESDLPLNPETNKPEIVR
jgi:hypothetical protein